MTDTPEEIKKLQLKIWFDKTPAERLHQMMLDNEALFQFWRCLNRANARTIINTF